MTSEGEEVLDFTSGFGTCSVGHAHPRVVEALTRQVSALAHCTAGGRRHDKLSGAIDAVLAAVGRESGYDIVFTGSGSEAVEVAAKMASLATGRSSYISFAGSFHGQIGAALSLTSYGSLKNPFRSYGGPEVHFTTYACGGEGSDSGKVAIQRLEQMLSDDRVGCGPVAAVIVEPVQNMAGYRIPTHGFLRDVDQLCKRTGTLLIADEIFTGFGRVGEWLASDAAGCSADIICVGKGLLGGIAGGACIAPSEIVETLDTSGMLGYYGSTFAANPITCAAMIATLGVLSDEDLISRSRDLGGQAVAHLSAALSGSPRVAAVRGQGLAIAVELLPSCDRQVIAEILQRSWHNGVYARASGYPKGNVITICPPLNIPQEDLVRGIEILTFAIESDCGVGATIRASM